MLQKKIEGLIKVGDVLKTFVSGHPEALDQKGVAELDALRGRLNTALTSITGGRSFITEERSNRKEVEERLRRAVKESRRALDLVAVRKNKPFEMPNFGPYLQNPLRIYELGAKYVEALEAAGSDPILDETHKGLKSALEDYGKSRGEVSQRTYESRSYLRGLEKETAAISGKLKSICDYAAFNVPDEERRKLYAHLRAVRPASHNKSAKNKKEENTNTSGQPATTTTTVQAVA